MLKPPSTTESAKTHNVLSPIYIITSLWCLIVISGMCTMMSYSNRGGNNGAPPSNNPNAINASQQNESNTLLLFLHPKCSCSLATVREMSRIIAYASRPIDIHIVFAPISIYQDVSETKIWSHASLLPSVNIVVDRNGDLIKQYAVKTSGHALLYNPHGKLMFSGGITSGRGHEGDNSGKTAVIALISGQRALINTVPVFGCPLMGSQMTPGE